MLRNFEPILDALRPRYDLVSELGGGGMAAVFGGRDTELGRDVAVKVLRPDAARFIGHDRFLREIAILRSLDHPHIVPLLDAGSVRDIPYLVMPLIAGATLRDLILDSPEGLPVDRTLSIARDVAAAVDHAHRQNIMHRDIKPENILLAEAGAIVADFGLARAVEAAGGDSLSSSGLVLGTAAYMSPEQADPGREVDARTDVYALGCVIFEMLTGEPPFTGATAQAIMARHLAETPPRIGIVRPDVSAAMERGVLAALEKLPARRPASAGALITLLEPG